MKLSDEEVAAIIKRDMPSWVLVDRSQNRRANPSVTPEEIRRLRRKYFGDEHATCDSVVGRVLQ